jgi:hypothetical protein
METGGLRYDVLRLHIRGRGKFSNIYLIVFFVGMDSGDWIRTSGKGIVYGGITGDHTLGNSSGYYMRVPESSSLGSLVHLNSPCINKPLPSCLGWWYAASGITLNALDVFAFDGSTWNNVTRVAGYSLPWKKYVVTLPASTRQVRFRYSVCVNSCGMSYDVGIDDISLSDGECDLSPPVLFGVTSASSAPHETTVTFTFSMPVIGGVGVVRFISGSTVYSFQASQLVFLPGGVASARLGFSLTKLRTEGATWDVEIDSGAVKNELGYNFTGLSRPNSFSFKTTSVSSVPLLYSCDFESVANPLCFWSCTFLFSLR